MRSIQDLLRDTENLSVDIAYPPKSAFSLAYPDQDGLWAYADGLISKTFYDRLNGRCSLNVSRNFSMHKFERETRADFNRFRDYLATRVKPGVV